MLECKIGCLGPQRGRLPWATQQMNDGRNFASSIFFNKPNKKIYNRAKKLYKDATIFVF